MTAKASGEQSKDGTTTENKSGSKPAPGTATENKSSRDYSSNTLNTQSAPAVSKNNEAEASV